MLANQLFDSALLQPTAVPTALPAKKEDAFICLPVTVRMINHAAQNGSADGVLRIHDVHADVVVVVGAIETASQQSASFDLALNDGTGRIRARWFISNNEDAVLSQMRPGTYVSIAAHLRTSPTLHLSVLTARLVRSADEISYHSIEAAHAALKIKRIALQRTQETFASTPSPKKHAPTALPLETTPAKVELAQQSNTVEAVEQKQSQVLSGVALTAAVSQFLQREGEGKEEGVNVMTIVSGLASSASETDIRSALENLVNNGDVFRTIDEDHFQFL